jgi:hypothetical protein
MSKRQIRQIDRATRIVRDVTILLDLPLSLARKMTPLNKLIRIRIRLMMISILNMETCAGIYKPLILTYCNKLRAC